MALITPARQAPTGTSRRTNHSPNRSQVPAQRADPLAAQSASTRVHAGLIPSGRQDWDVLPALDRSACPDSVAALLALADSLLSPAPGEPRSESPELLVVGRLVAAQGLAGELRVLPLTDFPERFTRPGRRWLQARAGLPQAVMLRGGRQLPGKELFVVRLEGIESRTAAEALVGHELLVLATDRPRLEPGEFHLLDLVGLEVRLLGAAKPSAGVASQAPGVASTPTTPTTPTAATTNTPVSPAGPLTTATTATTNPAVSPAGPLSTEPIGTVCDLIHAGNDLLEVELSAAAAARAGRRVFIPFVEAIVPVVNLAEGWIGITPPPGLLDL